MKFGPWQDLWNRRVPHIIGIYLGISWALLEFVGFMVDQYVLSPHLVTFSLVALVSLLPSAAIVAYFHGTPGRQGWTKVEKVALPSNLVAVIVLLALMFSGKDLGAATTVVTVTDEEGVTADRVIPKSEFRRRITVYFFDAEPEDTAATWLQYGLPVAFLVDLSQDQFIEVRAPESYADKLKEAGFEELVDVPLSLARELAEELHRDHFVTGTVAVVEGKVQATVYVYEANRGRLLEEHTFVGDDVFALADEISLQLREDLKVPDLGEEGAQDLPVTEILTDDLGAFRLYSEAIRALIVDQDFPRSVSLLEGAVEGDPTFALAQGTLGSLYIMTNQGEAAAPPLQAAMDHIYRLPERARFLHKHNYYFVVREDVDKAWAVLDMWADLFPDDLDAHSARFLLQSLNDDKEGALASLQTILDLDPGQRDVLLQIGNLQEAMGDFATARETFQEYAEEFPQNHQVLTELAGLARRTGDPEGAKDYYERALLLDPSDVGLTVGMAEIERSLGNFDEARGLLEDAESMAGTPQARAQVHAAYEGFFHARGQLRRQIEHAEIRLAEAASYTPDLTLIQLRLGEAGTYAESGRMEEAWALVQEARSRLPPPYDALVVTGELDIYLTLDDADGIEATLPGVEEFIARFQYEILRPRVYHAQGRIHELRGGYREAIGQYEEQRRLNPSDTGIPMQLARCYRGLGEYDQAVSLLLEALKGSPYGPQTNFEMALTYEAMGRMGDARRHLERAMKAWVEADESYEPAAEAREALKRLAG